MHFSILTEKERKYIEIHRNDDVQDLLLRGSKDADIDIRKMAVQISGWQQASRKLPKWASTEGIIYPEHLSMEQCSSEATASYKGMLMSRLITSNVSYQMPASPAPSLRFTDLTGGFGVDATMISLSLKECHTTIVERNEALCEITRHNLPLLGVKSLEVACAECENILDSLPPQDAVFIDPARRDNHGRKTVAIEDCTPDICRLQYRLLEKARIVMVKLSPMLDLSQALRKLDGVREVHVVGTDGECKELLLILSSRDNAIEDDIHVCCVNIKGEKEERFEFTYEVERTCTSVYAHAPLHYLYEPNACILKAGAYKSAGHRFGLEKLSVNSHLYTSDHLNADFPGRCFEVAETFPFNKAGIKRLHAVLSKTNITVRNFPLTVAELRKRLKLKEGGSDYLFATTLSDSSLVLILCRKPASD